MDKALEILIEMRDEASANRQKHLPANHNYDHLIENSTPEADYYGNRIGVLEEAIRRLREI